MPAATDPDPRLNIDPVEVGAAVGITAATGADYQFTDGYGVTYTGAPAHLALSALARRDLTCHVYPDRPAVAVGIRDAALTLIDWFTSPYADPQHATEFAALPPMRVCELVVYLCLHGDPDALNKVGPKSLRYYTDHLLHDPVPSADHPLPPFIDQPYRSLTGADPTPRQSLQVTATATGGADEVAVPMEIEASENISWQFTAAIPVPVDELNELLLDPDHFAGDYITENRELIDDYLTYRDSHTEQDLAITGRPRNPEAALNTAPARPVEIELFFVGPDRDSALETAPFGSRGLAEQFAGTDDRVFSAEIKVDTDAAVHALA